MQKTHVIQDLSVVLVNTLTGLINTSTGAKQALDMISMLVETMKTTIMLTSLVSWVGYMRFATSEVWASCSGLYVVKVMHKWRPWPTKPP